MNPWPHQVYGIRETLAARARGCRRLCLSSPTGGGKTFMTQQIALPVLAEGRSVALYTNRVYLIEQISAALDAAGIEHGVRAADFDDERERPFQVCSIQAEASRVLKRQQMKLHACEPGDLAIIDEGHLHTSGEKTLEIRKRHLDGGAMTLDVTATPLGMAGVCDELLIAGNNSELRACGALVKASHFGVDEPDLKAFKKLREGEDPSAAQQRTAIMNPTIMARVWKHYTELNPNRKPALLFGPDVAGSLWFAEQFEKAGVRAAHLDGDDAWIAGKFYKSDRSLREEIREMSKAGRLDVVCNRFVLREGIDWPWIQHIILAFVAGNLQTYLQIGGRGLRAYPGKTECIIQDHGGAWWRHGSLNEDRLWRLPYTSEIAFGIRADRLRNKKQRAPFVCPRCKRVWVDARECNPALGGCGYTMPPPGPLRSRAVVSTDGDMRELSGDAFKPRRITKDPRGKAAWERMYWRSRTKKGRRSFRAAAALFCKEDKRHGWPDPTWPYMPTEELDWFLAIPDVPMERLISVQQGATV